MSPISNHMKSDKDNQVPSQFQLIVIEDKVILEPKMSLSDKEWRIIKKHFDKIKQYKLTECFNFEDEEN